MSPATSFVSVPIGREDKLWTPWASMGVKSVIARIILLKSRRGNSEKWLRFLAVSHELQEILPTSSCRIRTVPRFVARSILENV